MHEDPNFGPDPEAILGYDEPEIEPFDTDELKLLFMALFHKSKEFLHKPCLKHHVMTNATQRGGYFCQTRMKTCHVMKIRYMVFRTIIIQTFPVSYELGRL